MASTTKIMTAILVLESGEDLDTTVKVSAQGGGHLGGQQVGAHR